MSSIFKDAEHVTLTWIAKAATSYYILASSQIEGDYQRISLITTKSAGPLSVTLKVRDNAQFFKVEEASESVRELAPKKGRPPNIP